MLLSKSTQNSLWSFTLNIFFYFQQKRAAKPSFTQYILAHFLLLEKIVSIPLNMCITRDRLAPSCIKNWTLNISLGTSSMENSHIEQRIPSYPWKKKGVDWGSTSLTGWGPALHDSRSERKKWNQSLLQQILSYLSSPFPVPKCIVLIWECDLFVKYLVGGRGGEQSCTKLPRAADRGK